VVRIPPALIGKDSFQVSKLVKQFSRMEKHDLRPQDHNVHDSCGLSYQGIEFSL